MISFLSPKSSVGLKMIEYLGLSYKVKDEAKVMVRISAGIWRQKGGWMRGSHEAQLRNRWRRLRVSAVEIQILCDISLSFCHAENFEGKL